MWRGFRYTSSAIVVGVAGATNLYFAWTTAAEPPAKGIMLALAAASAIGTASGPHFIRQHFARGCWGPGFAALFWFGCCLTWDGWSAYGFTARQHEITATDAGDIAQRRADATQDVSRAKAQLDLYVNAGDPGATEATAREKLAAADALAKQPGVTTSKGICARRTDEDVRRTCTQRDQLLQEAAEAQTASANGRAREKAEARLIAAQRYLDGLPQTPPADPRAQMPGGAWVVEWMPVIMLTIGAALSFFAVPQYPTISVPHATKPRVQAPAPEPEVPVNSVTDLLESPPRQRRRKGQAGGVKLADTIIRLSAQPGSGLVLDANGWLRGTQRAFAEASGFGSSTGRFSRALHDSVGRGELELDTSGNLTAIRPRSPETP